MGVTTISAPAFCGKANRGDFRQMQPESTWTEERVTRLRELWAQGKTASEIAMALGGAVSRNAVIGKVHRLKLSGRPSPIKHRPLDSTPMPATGSATILALGDRSCKWPMGDPLSPDFHFCGKSAGAGIPYCTDHAHLAYQPKKMKSGN